VIPATVLQRALFCFCLALAAPACIAQDADPTLQLDLTNVQNTFLHEGAPTVGFRASYERKMSGGILWGLDLHVNYNALFGADKAQVGEWIEHDGWLAYCAKDLSTWGLTYRTGYFFYQ